MVMLTQLADVLRREGLKVEEVPGWKTRGRPASTGGFDPVGVLCHHTATAKSSSDAAVIRLLVEGRPDLPGPLCQLGLGRDGTVYVVAAGRANHAGKAAASGTVAAGDGNQLYVGIEAFNDGRGETWPAAQYDAYVRLCAVLSLKVTGNSAQTVRGHKETSVTGKVDPTFDMDAFRGRVAAAMEPPKPRTVRARFALASLNLGDGADADKTADLNALAKRADAIGVQEAGDRRGAIDAFLAAHPSWAQYVGDIPGAHKVPVLYDTTVLELDPEHSRAVQSWGGGKVGPGAGPDTAGPKVLTSATFTHKPTGRRLHILNHHLIASHTRPLARLRKSVAVQQADAFEREAERCRGLVFGCGDFNAPKSWVAAQVDGFNVDNTGPTFRLRQIDHVGHFPHPAIRLGSQHVMETSGSRKIRDHRAVVVAYRIAVKEA